MKKLKTITIIALAALCFQPMTACEKGESQGDGPKENLPEAVAFAQTLGVGWNLGNNLDAHNDGVAIETGWGNGEATQKTFDAVRKAGFSSVRIPVTWLGHIGPGPEFHIEKAWMDRVATVASYAKKAGLKAIINIHHDGFGAETDPVRKGYFWLDLAAAAKDEAVNTRIKQKLAMVWMQIATRFKDEGDWLIFETLNEIQDGKWGNGENLTDGGLQYRTLNEWNQLCVDVIRATGGKNTTRYIGVPGYVCQPGLTVDYLAIPQDETPNRIMVAVHMYDPWDYAGSGKYNEWGHTGVDTVPDKAGEVEYVNTLNRLYMKFIRKGIPVYMGEYGCVRRATRQAEDFRRYYLEYTIKAMADRHIPLFWWDNGNSKSGDDGFGLMRHDDGRYLGNGEETVRLMIEAWTNRSKEYTLQSIWERAPKK